MRWWSFTTGTSGRIYLGFDATSGGARSLIIAPNTRALLFQQNTSFGFSNRNSTPYSAWATTRWYRMEIEFLAGNVTTGRLYDSDGTTVLATVTETWPDAVTGGVAIRSFGGLVTDTIRVCF